MWNIRVVKESTDEGDIYNICEVYYDHIGNPIAYCKADASEGNVQDLQHYLAWMVESLTKPHYKTTDFKKKYANDTE